MAHETDHEQADWTRGESSCKQYMRHLYHLSPSDFKVRLSGKLASLGDDAMNARKYDVAISQYTTALSLNPATLGDLLGKRSKAHASRGEWEDALIDANEVAHFNSFEFLCVNGFTQVIKLDPSSPLGYEGMHEALHAIGCHDDTTGTFEVMLLKMSKSYDPDVRGEGNHVLRLFFFVDTLPQNDSATISR